MVADHKGAVHLATVVAGPEGYVVVEGVGEELIHWERMESGQWVEQWED